MFSFSRFGVPVVVAGFIFAASTIWIGGCCFWHRLRGNERRMSSPYPDSQEPERPQLWDLFIEDPVGSKIDETRWENFLPFSVTRWATTERSAVPEKAGVNNATRQRSRHTRKTGVESEGPYYHHLRIAVAIAMPSAPHPSRNSSSMDETESLPYCMIGLQEVTVEGLDLPTRLS
ncbi:hypothetical protein B0H11DRAFT_337100 [Mycena galericulata]|nr:hypothetical protein B0H11DRAFT_820904 [Mycena galericulata]KAJ7449113.1 hypothetical protein B0H11DRAFT_337100 [Mycena galericulata]